MTEFTHKVLTADDAESYMSLRREVMSVSPVGMGLTLDEELSRPVKVFREQLSVTFPSQIFGTFANDQLVATAGILWPSQFPSGAHKTILWGVFTAPSFRRQSLARYLVEKAIAHAFSNNALRIYLYVHVPNEPAVGLYESLGFRTSGAEPEELNLGGQYFDLQYMSLRNPTPRGPTR